MMTSVGSMLWMALGLGVAGFATVQSNGDDDSRMVEAVLAGDANAFRGLVENYQTRIYNIIYGMVHNRDDAMELTQDAFIKAYKKLDSFRLGTKFYTWLCRIGVNTAIDFLRKQKHRQTLSFEEEIGVQADGDLHSAHSEGNPELVALGQEQRQVIIQAVDQLPEDQKQVLILKEIDGLSYKEISLVLGIPHGTVMSRLFYARKRLQEVLERPSESEKS